KRIVTSVNRICTIEYTEGAVTVGEIDKNNGGNMSTEDGAMRLVELCKGSEWKKAVDDLYAKDIVSVEPRQVANMPAESRGIDQVRGKNDWWENNMEVHDS